MDLRSKIIKLAYENPSLRKELLPLLKEASDEKDLRLSPKEIQASGLTLVSADLSSYFSTKVGQKIRLSAITGDKLFTGTYARGYFLEIVEATPATLSVNVTSVDLVPSGIIESGSNKRFGMVEVPYARDPDTTLQKVIQKADPKFFKAYPKVDWK